MSDDIVARARAALEDSYHVLHGSELVAELADEVERLRAIPAEVRAARELAEHSAFTLEDALTACGIAAERDRLAATVERVWGLAVKMKGEHGQSWNTISGQRILAALDDAWDSGSGDPS